MRTAVFDTISSLRPYFFSLREIKGNVSLDIRIPLKWRYDGYREDQIRLQDQNNQNQLLSIISTATKDGYNEVFTLAKGIIKTNMEEEEKLKLFNQKVEELKTVFLNSSLDKLKDISFDKQLKKDGLRNKKSSGEIRMGNQEGSGTDGTI